MNRRRAVIFLGIMLIVISAKLFAEVFKTIDENGKVTYTDSPAVEKKADVVEISNTNTQPPIKKIQIRPTPEKPIKPATPSYNARIVSPVEGAKVLSAAGIVKVAVSTSKKLGSRQVNVTIGGSSTLFPNGEQAGSVPITKSMRGKQTITAQIVDSKGKVLSTSSPVTIYIIHPGGKR